MPKHEQMKLILSPGKRPGTDVSGETFQKFSQIAIKEFRLTPTEMLRRYIYSVVHRTDMVKIDFFNMEV